VIVARPTRSPVLQNESGRSTGRLFLWVKKCREIIGPFLPTAEEKLEKKDAIRTNGKHYIEFKGSGNPKGPLAERMD